MKSIGPLFQRCLDNGHLYKDSYTGPYCVSDELYATDGEVGGECGVIDDDVARLAVFPHDANPAGANCGRRPGEERFVAAAVEHGTGVITHSAVDGDVGADAGDGGLVTLPLQPHHQAQG